MPLTTRKSWAAVSAITLVLLFTAAGQAQAQQRVSGIVTDQTTSAPVAGARVEIVGTTLVTETGPDGRYTLSNVPLGDRQVRVTMLGYSSANQTASVTAGATAAADFALEVAVFTLDEMVVTATGDQARREVGNSIPRIDASELTQTRPIANMNDLLTARAPGVTATPGNLTGSEARIRIRGNNSLSLNNDPVYYIDGIRMESSSGSSSIGIGGTMISRVNDINPEEIESIEIVKGPSASTLYGTDAANGVIVIKTKKGRPGNAQWQAYAEAGVIRDNNTYPTAYRGWTEGSESDNNLQCFLTGVAAEECTQDRITTFNIFEDPDASPNGTGHRQQYGLSVSGGTEAIRYFLSGEWEDEVGVLVMPEFAQQSLTSSGEIDELRDDQLRPNARRRVSVRANVGATVHPNLDVDISTGFVTSNQRLPQTDNNTTGLLSNAFGGPGQKDNIDSSTGRQLLGYRLFTPDQFFSETVEQDINRVITSGTATWTPKSWFTGRLTGGVDYTSRVDTDLCRRGECVPFNATFLSGFKEDNRTNIFEYTLDASGAFVYPVSGTLSARSTVGAQFVKSVFNRNGAFAEDLAPGATTVTSGSIPAADEATTNSATFGTFVQQQFGWRDRLWVTGAVRLDDNSAFGADFSAVAYPKFSLSWVISDEDFFPASTVVSDLRFRTAWGASGVQPGTTDAVAFFTPSTASVDNEDDAALVFSALGNTRLKPERSEEFEVGLDAGLFNDRVVLETTYYRKTTKDALIERVVAPSVGAANDRFENLGSVRNSGWEALIRAQVVDAPNFGLDLTIAGSHNGNELVELGTGVAPIIGTTISQKEGYPLNSYWLRPYSFEDGDGNNIITADEITVGDTAIFIGPNQPVNEVTLGAGLDLFRRSVRVNALFDYRGGHYQLNGTERIRCQSRLNCEGLIDPGAALWEQARVVALRETPAATQFGFVEDAEFLRFRELAVTYDLPDRFAQAFAAQRVSITASARNLHVFTGYSGIDPEAGYFGGGDNQTDFQTQAPPTYWTFRANISF